MYIYIYVYIYIYDLFIYLWLPDIGDPQPQSEEACPDGHVGDGGRLAIPRVGEGATPEAVTIEV